MEKTFTFIGGGMVVLVAVKLAMLAGDCYLTGYKFGKELCHAFDQ